MKPTISIVVPVYKVEKYINRCIDSILSQSFSDFELILVNDGSPDNCEVICDEYAKKDDRIKVIHKENGGLSSARNAGIDIARGEYIGFVDSDDWIEHDMYELLYNNMKEYDAEISICKIKVEYNDEKEIYSTDNNEETVLLNNKEALRTMVEQSLFDTGSFDKLYKMELFQDVRYPEGKLYEDLATTYKLFHRSKKVVFNSSTKYHYVLNPNSIMRSNFNLKQLDVLEAANNLYEFVNEYYPSAKKAALCRYVSVNIGLFIMMTRSGYKNQILFKECREVVVGNIVTYLKAKWVKRKMKIYAISIFVHPLFFKCLYDLILGYKRLRKKFS